MASVPRVLTRPPRTPGPLARPRLNTGVAGRLTVVIGPAGAGKSVFAAQAADAGPARTIWVRLAPNWSSLSLLPAMIGACLGIEVDETADPGEVVDLVLGHLEDEPTCLVIDDLHEADGDLESVLAEVVSFLPPDSALIVVSRRRPALLIGRSDPRSVRVVDADELAFDRDELAQLLDTRGGGDVDAALAATNGSAALAVAFAERGTSGDPTDGVLVGALSADALGEGLAVARTLAAVPYADVTLLTACDHDPATIATLAERTSLVQETEGRWVLHATAREHLLGSADPAEVTSIRHRAGRHLVDEDAPTAVELLIEAEAFDEAGAVLARHASAIGPARATRWLYRLPAEVRRRLPPLLTDGRATVNVDLALEAARRRVAETTEPRALREGLAGLGSLLLAEARLAESADALESAFRLADDDHRFRAVVGTQVATVRWLAGDHIGAIAMLDDLTPSMWTGYLRTVLAADAGDPAATRHAADAALAQEADRDGTAAPAHAADAIAALVAGEDPTGAAEAAYLAASPVGGRDLAVAAPVHGWALLRQGRLDAAAAVTDRLDRTVARHDHLARLHSAHLRQAIDHARGEPDGGRAQRRVTDLGGLGLAPVVRLIDLLRGDTGDDPGGLLVEFCGSFAISVDGVALAPTAWKSKKARDVCALLADAGQHGLRREQVIEAIWTGRDPHKGRSLLRTALTEIRRVLEPRRGTGQESRFVTTVDDRVVVLGDTDLARADRLRGDDPSASFALLALGPAGDGPDADWFDAVATRIDRARVDAASRVAADPLSAAATRVQALEVLLDAEPWQRAHFRALADLHRELGDDHAADDVDRRWFADD